MIFGDNPPENWRENPEFSLYLAEMGNMGVERIAVEGERVSGQLRTLQQQTQDLASDNYKTFIQTSNCTAEIYKEFATTEEHLGEVLDKLGHFRTDCSEFQTISQVAYYYESCFKLQFTAELTRDTSSVRKALGYTQIFVLIFQINLSK